MLKFLLTVALMLLTAASHVSIAAEYIAEGERQAVATYFAGADEPTVEAAVWTSANEFNVGVHYMGSREDSFARYVCSILRKRGLGGGTSVNVIDINTMSLESEKWEVVGETVCKE